MLRKNRFKILYMAFFGLALALAAWRLPAYASRMPWLLVMAAADIYLFKHYTLYFMIMASLFRRSLFIFAIVPSFMLLVFLFSMSFLSPHDWNHSLRTYWLGIIAILYIIRSFPLIYMIGADVRDYVFIRLENRKPDLLSGWGMRISYLLSFFTFTLLLWGMIFTVYNFEVEDIRLKSAKFPQSFNEYKIVQISDLHLGRWHSSKPLKRAVNLANDLQPDLIVFTGDLVNYATEEAYPAKSLLKNLRATDGIIAVLGNHDYGDYLRWPDAALKENNYLDMLELLAELGWDLLENDHKTLFRGSDSILVVGVANFSRKHHFPNRADLLKAYRGINDSTYTILLSHTPEILEEEAINYFPFDLLLAGHTHAGQIGVRIGKRSFSAAAGSYKFWNGLYEISTPLRSTSYVYVNRGLGHIGIPLRIGMRPEITLITLSADQGVNHVEETNLSEINK